MQKTSLRYSIFFSILSSQVFCQTAPLEDKSTPPLRISFKHIEGKGIGYNEGYSSLEGFFAPNLLSNFSPFIDGRIHVFNNGLPAANAGLGLRYLSERALGVNVYYDFRKTSHRQYNQVSAGLESLGKIWDFRINGYLPIFGKISSPFDPKFAYFTGHSMILSEKKEIALKNIEAEIATHAIKVRNAPAYLAAGPYYLTGKAGSAWGGKARFSFNFFSYLSGEAIASYDTLFKGIIQGRISLNIPLGPYEKNPSKKTFRKTAYAHQKVDRNEIIATDKARFDGAVAINPATNKPYVFWFVDNTSSSNGTYESPYPRLAQAESHASKNDVIYIYPGNGTSVGLDTGFVMKEGQRLLGSGTSQVLPIEFKGSTVNITIPAQSKTLPLLTLSDSPGYNTGIITLNDNCEVSGLHIDSLNNLLGQKLAAIMGGPATIVASHILGVKNASIHNNVIEGTYYEGGIYLHNSQDTFLLSENTLTNITALNAITCINDVSDISLSSNISDNAISHSSGGGIYFQNTSGITVAHQNILIANNLITNSGNDGISIFNNGDTLASTITEQDIQILENSVTSSGENGIIVLNNKTVSIADQKTRIFKNTVNTCSNGRAIYFFNNGINMNIDVQKIEIANNTISSPSLQGIYVLNYNNVTMGSQETLISHNTVNSSKTTGISFSNNLTITSENQRAILEFNIISDSLDNGIYLQNQGPTNSHPLCIFVRDNIVNKSTNFGITTNSFSESQTNAFFEENLIMNTQSSISMGFTSNSTSTICTTIIENNLDKNLVFDQRDTSLLEVTPLINNLFMEVLGTYTPVPEGTCDCE